MVKMKVVKASQSRSESEQLMLPGFVRSTLDFSLFLTSFAFFLLFFALINLAYLSLAKDWMSDRLTIT